jgi:hypothetical protein
MALKVWQDLVLVKTTRFIVNFEEQDSFTLFRKKGNFKLNEMVDIILINIPYHLITRKILQWFIYDRPKEDLVRYYGDYFKR